ncbi:MAG: hypothetical protein QCH99_01525 [Candidatus Bathyarchaeota archaeon]|nr:hypothetical protein [Candidatus Bathyarchaeum tardum]
MLSKKLFLITVIVLGWISFPSVDASSNVWRQFYETDQNQNVYSMIATMDGGYSLAGGYGNINDFWLIKIDQGGNIQWNRTYGGEKKDYATCIVETGDGGYALAGSTQSFGGGEEDFWLVKTDADGNMQWNRTYGGPRPEKVYSLIETSDGGYALVGYVTIPDLIKHNILVTKRNDDFWVVKTDSKGNMEWNQTYGGKEYERAYSVVEANDGGFVIVGDSWLVKIDSQGNTEWEQKDLVGAARSLVKTSDGGYALTGGGFLIKTDSLGNIQWNQTHGGTSLVETADGGFAFLSGASLVKTDTQGNVVWTEKYEPRYEWSSLRLSSVIETSDGGYIIAGNLFEFFTGKSVILLGKTDEYGIIPEFPLWTALPLVIAVVLVAVIYRKKLTD